MSTDESADFVRRAGVTVTSELLEQIDNDVRRLAITYLGRPPFIVLRPLAELRRDVISLIERHPKPGYLPQLYAAVSRLSSLLAHAASDLGQPEAARTHIRTAYLSSDLAGDPSLRAYAGWVESNLAYWQGEYGQAARVARDAHDYATTTRDALRLASQAARALAAARDASGATRTLKVATDIRHGMPRQTSRDFGVFQFQDGKAAYYAAETLLSVGGKVNERVAANEATEAIALLKADMADGEDSGELLAAAHVDLVLADLALGNLDGASEHIRYVLSLPTENRTVPIVKRVRTVNRALSIGSHVTSATAIDLRAEISIFCEFPARANSALPQGEERR